MSSHEDERFQYQEGKIDLGVGVFVGSRLASVRYS